MTSETDLDISFGQSIIGKKNHRTVVLIDTKQK